MESCALGLPVDGSKDGKISCFKITRKVKKCKAGERLLKDRTVLLKRGELWMEIHLSSDEDVIEKVSKLTHL